MRKFGRISNVVHQQCLSHGIHLAVLDVAYKSMAVGTTAESSDDEDESDGDDGEDQEIQAWALADSYEALIKRVRKICKMFRQSPVKNDFLVRCCREKHLPEVTLRADVKTRWNSMVGMIRRFINIFPAVQPALMEFGQSDLIPTAFRIFRNHPKSFSEHVCDCLSVKPITDSRGL